LKNFVQNLLILGFSLYFYLLPPKRTRLTKTDLGTKWHIDSTHDSGARGPGFDSHPGPDGFIGSLIYLLSDNRLKNDIISL
jgi:hypothetical protein